MSTSKHIDKICIAIIAITVALAVLFMFGGSIGIAVAARTMPYESGLFDTSYVHTIDIVMDDWDSFIETCENEEYALCTVVVDGVKYSNTAIRAKGNTSLSSVSSLNSDRYSFKLEFDHYDNGQTLQGLDKLCLNNLIQDNTMMKDYIVYQMMNGFDVDSPLCSFSYLTVNGEDWGLYLAIEGVEDSFLTRNYGSGSGDLYKPDSMSFGAGRGNGKEFSMSDLDFDFSDFSFGNNDTGNTDTDSGNTESDSGTSFTPGSMGEGGFGPGTMGEGGFDPSTMGEGGFDPSTMGEGGFDPSTMGEGGFDPSTMGEGGFDPSTMGEGGFDPSTMGEGGFDPSSLGENVDTSSISEGGFKQSFGGGMGGGMGSDDVKLKYIDDDPDSYSNIFDNAKTDVTSADQKRLIKALENLSTYSDLENTVDIEEVIRYFVIHNFVCNGDSYTGSMIHNYYLYEENGILSMIPWDYNLAFGTFQGGNASSTVNTSIDSPVSSGTVDDRPMLGWIFSNDEYTEQYHTLFAKFTEEWIDSGKLETMISETAEMIRPYVEKDPTKFCTTEEFDAGVTALTQFVNLRGQAVANQLNGDSTTVDTGSLNLSDMGTMGNTAGGGGAGKQDNRNANTSDNENIGKEEFSPNQESENTVSGTSEGDTNEASGNRPAGGGRGGRMPGGNTPPGSEQTGDGTESGNTDGMGETSGNMTEPPQKMEENTNGTDTGDKTSSSESDTNDESVDMQENGENTGNMTPPSQDGDGNADGTNTERRTMPSGFDPTSMNNSDFQRTGGNSEVNKWILLGVSALVLALGIVVAVKKKY